MKRIQRCFPVNSQDLIYQHYHDYEWGKLNLHENYLYEMLVLETFQSGLSWATILHKRKNFAQAFANWDYEAVAHFDQKDCQRLMHDRGIIRNRLKIKAAINNAQMIVKLHQTGKSLASLLQPIVPQPIMHHPQSFAEVPTKDQTSKSVTQALKQAGFKFVGPTTMYSYLQAIGLINDHLESCPFKYAK